MMRAALRLDDGSARVVQDQVLKAAKASNNACSHGTTSDAFYALDTGDKVPGQLRRELRTYYQRLQAELPSSRLGKT